MLHDHAREVCRHASAILGPRLLLLRAAGESGLLRERPALQFCRRCGKDLRMKWQIPMFGFYPVLVRLVRCRTRRETRSALAKTSLHAARVSMLQRHSEHFPGLGNRPAAQSQLRKLRQRHRGCGFEV